MTSFKCLDDFSGLYPISRTVRFQLKPVGKTEEHIKLRNLIERDEVLSEHCKTVKKIIDRCHKKLIDKALSEFVFDEDDLLEFARLYNIEKISDSDKKSFEEKRNKMRKDVAAAFKKYPEYHMLCEKGEKKKNLIQSGLDSVCENDAEKNLVHEFDKRITIFSDFLDKRKNIYSNENKSTTISCRIVEQNLPKFLNNIKTYKKCIDACPDIFSELSPELTTCFGINSLDDIFQCKFYSSVLTQASIERFNSLVGGYSLENGAKTQGLNELINLHNQKNKSRLPQFIPLFKQVLSDRVQELSFLPAVIQDDNTLLEMVRAGWNSMREAIIKDIPELFGRLKEFELSGIFIANDNTLTDIVQQSYGSYDRFRDAWFVQYEKQNPRKKSSSMEKYYEEMEKAYKRIGSFSIAEIQRTVFTAFPECPGDAVEEFFVNPCIVIADAKRPLFAHVQQAYKDVEELLSSTCPEGKKHTISDGNIQILKRFLDALKAVQRFVRMPVRTGFQTNRDMSFYAQLDKIVETLEPVTMLYNQVRNYVSAKPYSTEKFKLNFDCMTLLNGWDKNKEKDNFGTLFKKDGAYYLGIIRRGAKIDFESASKKSADEAYEKMVYKLVANPERDFPHTFFSKERREQHNIPANILDIRDKHKSVKCEWTKEEYEKLIQFYMDSVAVHPDWKKFGCVYSEEAKHDLKLFFKESKNQCYSVGFERIPAEYINGLVEKGDLYLFQIWNKDFSKFSKGTPNIHTLYWKALLDQKNLSDVIFKLSGDAEVFYRKSSITNDKMIRHSANMPIPLRRNPQENRTFDYELIKDRRFTYDQFSFHAKIEINYKANEVNDLNVKVLEWLSQEENPHIIGIDRGERNLIYIAVIDKEGRIVYQKSLNAISSEVRDIKFSTDYHELLDKREKEKLKAQKSWQTIEKIKDLKAGYLSQVVHELVTLIRQYNAVICLEDLNSGFIRGRQKVDKSVYQQFEQALIQKLQYITDKKQPQDQPGSIMHGLQLVNKKNDVKGSQNGIVFYVPPWCTSKIDPKTGFVNLFGNQYLQYENIEKTEKFFSKFKEIRFNREDDFFEFSFDYSDFVAKAEGTRTEWTACSYGSRIENFRNQELPSRWDWREVNLTEELKKLFENNRIDISGGLKEQIVSHTDGKFLKGLLRLFKLTLQLRNSKPNCTKRGDDFIISPIRGMDGKFFDSRAAAPDMPQDADANGAYNIARKGLLLLQRSHGNSDKSKKEGGITQKDWLNFAQPK